MQATIEHDCEHRRFQTTVEGVRCELEYRLEGDRMTITHTRVPSEVGGRGIAGSLVEAAFAEARRAGWRVVPQCSYAAAWAERHPEVRDLLA